MAWKYKDEIKKMHKLQEQYKFLVRHDIHSVVDLALVENNLVEKRKEISSEKGKMYRANSKNKSLYEIVDAMDELKECENSYQNGDNFFEEEHNQWNKLNNQLKEAGYSYEEVKALKEHYHKEMAKHKELEGAAIKECKLAVSIRKDFVGDSDARIEEQTKEIQNMEKDMQPKR